MKEKVIIVGLDLAGSPRSESGICMIDNKLRVYFNSLKDDKEIIDFVLEANPHILAIDAPLTLPQGIDKEYGSRKCERIIQGLKGKYCQNPSFPPFSPVLISTLMLRGYHLYNILKQHVSQIIEVHPSTSIEFLGLSPKGKPRKKWTHDDWMGLYEALGEFLKMPDKGTDVTAHQIDAAFAALTAKLHLDGNTKQIGYKREGIIVVPRPRRLQLVIFDMDGTLTKVKSPWQFLHEELGVWESGGLQWLKDYKKKIIDYQKFVKLDSDLWIGRHKEEIEGRLSKIELQRGVKKVISGLDNMGIKTAILSTGFTFLGDRIRRITGVDIKTYANELIYDRWGLFKGVKMRVSQDPGRMSKRSLVRRICHDAKVSQVNTMAVGDSETDNEMFESVGLAVGFNLNVELDSVDVEIQDLEDILSLCQ